MALTFIIRLFWEMIRSTPKKALKSIFKDHIFCDLDYFYKGILT